MKNDERIKKKVKKGLTAFNEFLDVLEDAFISKGLKDEEVLMAMFNVLTNGTAHYFSQRIHGANVHAFTSFYMNELGEAFFKAKEECIECGNLHKSNKGNA